jgi:hypothetical protein
MRAKLAKSGVVGKNSNEVAVMVLANGRRLLAI